MFGLSNLFAALRRLTTSVNTTADLWDAANDQLLRRLVIDVADDGDALPALTGPVEQPAAGEAAPEPPARSPRNGRGRDKAPA